MDELSLWEFNAAVGEYAKAHDPKGDKALTASEEEALWGWLKE